MTEDFGEWLHRPMIETASLFQLYEKHGKDLDGFISSLVCKPVRQTTVEDNVPSDLPYCHFVLKQTKNLVLSYNFKEHDYLNIDRIRESCISHGIDDCPIEDIVIHLVDNNKKVEYWLRFHTTTIKLTTQVGRYVKKKRDDYIKQYSTNVSSKPMRGNVPYRQLEFKEGWIKEGNSPITRVITIQEIQDKEFLYSIQNLSNKLILIKSQRRYHRDYFRDDKFYDGVVDLSELDEDEEDGGD